MIGICSSIGRNLSASVQLAEFNFCNDPNILYACAQCNTEPHVMLACQLGLDSCPLVCQNPNATGGAVCPAKCANSICSDAVIARICRTNPNAITCPAACRPTACTDSDNGLNYYVSGITK